MSKHVTQRGEPNVRINGLMRLEIEGDLLFLAFVRENRADEENETVWWYSVVEL